MSLIIVINQSEHRKDYETHTKEAIKCLICGNNDNITVAHIASLCTQIA